MDAKGKIEALNGAQEFKQYASELVRVCRAARRRHLELELPVLIMVTESGLGNTTYLRLLSELVREEHMLPVSGEEEVFEWRILTDDEDPVARLMTRMEQAAGFYPYFSGVIGLDLSDCKEFEDLPDSLPELIRETGKKILFCLMITEKQASGFLARLEDRLRIHVRVKTIRLAAADGELDCYVRNEFRRRGFLLGRDMDEPIRNFVSAEGENGYRGLRLAIDEVIWKKMDRGDGLLIEAADLAAGRTGTRGQGHPKDRRRTIGFGACEP